MKNIKLFLSICLLSAFMMSCKKPTVAPSSNVSNADAANILAGSLSTNSYGVTDISNDVSVNAQFTVINNLSCGSMMTDTMTRNGILSATNYYYKLSYFNILNCNSSHLPDNVSSNLTFSGYFNTPWVSLTNSGTTAFTIAGLAATATIYTINGEYKSSGTFKLRSDTTNAGSANLDIVVKNVNISKTTLAINSGTATVIVTGTTLKKGDFTYNGTLTFNGSLMATMALNGSNYTINLATGIVTSK